MIVLQKLGLRLNWNWSLYGYKLRVSDQIKYLGIYLDKYINGHNQSKLVMQKLVRAFGILSRVRYWVRKAEQKNIYHALFESHLRHGCQVWYKSNSTATREKMEVLQKKALRTMCFSDPREPSSPLFKEWKILKIKRYRRHAKMSPCSFIPERKAT